MIAEHAAKRAVSSRGKGAPATPDPVKKKLTHVAVSICRTIMFRFFLSMPVIMVGSESICCEGLSRLRRGDEAAQGPWPVGGGGRVREPR